VKEKPRAATGWIPVQRDFLRRTDLSAKARFLGAVLATYAGADGIAYPSVKTLMELTGWGINAVKLARSELVKARMIQRVQEHIDGGRFGSIRWRVGSAVIYRKHQTSANGQKVGEGTFPQRFTQTSPKAPFTAQR